MISSQTRCPMRFLSNVSLQADAIMDQSEDKTGDGFNFGATLGDFKETGSIAIAHRQNQDVVIDSEQTVSESSSYVAGNYGIGEITVFFGYSRTTIELPDCTVESVNAQRSSACIPKGKSKSYLRRSVRWNRGHWCQLCVQDENRYSGR